MDVQMLPASPLDVCSKCGCASLCFCGLVAIRRRPITPDATPTLTPKRPVRTSVNYPTLPTRRSARLSPAKTTVLSLSFDLKAVTEAAEASQFDLVAETIDLQTLSATTGASRPPRASPPIDPTDKYHLYNYSSFTQTLDSPRSVRKRAKKDAHFEKTALDARKNAMVVDGPDFDVGMGSTPSGKRAGQTGSKITKKNLEKQRIVEGKRRSVEAKASQVSLSSSTPDQSSSPSPASADPISPLPGSNPFADEGFRRRLVEAKLTGANPTLKGFTFSHRSRIPGQATSFVDSSRRSFATRVELPSSLSTLPAELEKDVEKASSKGGIKEMKTDGSRGGHEIRQIGVHREQGNEAGYSGAFRRGIGKWTKLMNGIGMKRVRGHVSRCLEIHYPVLFAYHKSLALHLFTVSLYFLFGAFASFCLNTGWNVACRPHRDGHNLGPGLCGIFAWGDFDSTRSGWLVLEEAKLCVEVGSGDVFLFPSAIFTHWNTPLVGGDKRNSLAFWTGASLFLWSDCGGKSFKELSEEEQAARLGQTKKKWTEAWKRFPVL
ncbi:hypothetical protein P7C70_g4119, partial [Phenoliferia sp. Uapishka_3]